MYMCVSERSCICVLGVLILLLHYGNDLTLWYVLSYILYLFVFLYATLRTYFYQNLNS